jgi:hypothetical protein
MDNICFHTKVKNFFFLNLMQLKIRTDMNSDAPYESAVRTSLIPLHGRKSWGQLPSLLLKIEGGGGKLVLPPFLALNLRKKSFLL